MGAAGDMLLAALLELLPEKDAFLQKLNEMGLPGVVFSAEKVTRCGITGTHVTVTVHGQEEDCHDHHGHTTLKEIHQVIDGLDVSEAVKVDAKSVYDRLAQAESRVHGQTVEEVHFHEVGAWDAVADVVSVCLAMEALAPDRVLVSPVHVGFGHVQCAHGLLPVPAPATALLLEGVPTYGEVKGELCTPTGAALLTHFADSFGQMPLMKTAAIGYGCGKKEFERANCLRAFWGETAEEAEQILELACNLDDMTPEHTAFAMEQLLSAGALDVYTTAIGMKKSRPGVLLTCLCKQEDEQTMVQLLFRHTTTLGIRKTLCSRYLLRRGTEVHETPYGPVRRKTADGYGTARYKWEHDDLAEIATREGICLRDVKDSFV